MNRDLKIDHLLRFGGLISLLIAIVLLFVYGLSLITIMILLVVIIMWSAFFYRTRDPYLQIAQVLIQEYRSKRSIDFPFLFEILEIKGVKQTSEKGINYIEKKDGMEPIEMLKSRAVLTTKPRLTEAILCRIIAGIRGNVTEEVLARDLRVCATQSEEVLVEYLREELEDIPEEIIPGHIKKIHVWEEGIETEVFVIAVTEEKGSFSGNGKKKTAVSCIHKEMFTRIDSRDDLFDELKTLYDGFSLEEIRRMTTFVQAICIKAESGIAQVRVVSENGVVSDVWSSSSLPLLRERTPKNIEGVLEQLILLYNEEWVNGHVIVESDFPSPRSQLA